MKNHFLLSYFGNKRNEAEGLYNEVANKLDNITTIIEPFCGSSAFSYYESLKHPKKFEYILNDNNKFLIELYLIAQDEDKLKKFVQLLNMKIKDSNRDKYNLIIKEDNINGWLIKSRIYNIRPGLYPNDQKRVLKSFYYLFNCPIINFLRNEKMKFYNIDAITIIEQNKNNDKCLMFLDPPYLVSCNDFYKDSKVNIYEYLFNNKIENMNSSLLLCLEKNWIIELLFNGQIKKNMVKNMNLLKKRQLILLFQIFKKYLVFKNFRVKIWT